MLCLIYSFVEPYLIEEKTIIIKSSQIPQELSGKKIVFLADIHHGIFFSQKRLDKLISRVNNLSVDLILLGGDYADGGEKYIKQVASALSELASPLHRPIGVLGNHDYFPEKNLTLEALTDEELLILNNKNLVLTSSSSNSRFVIAGVEDTTVGWPNLDEALEDVQDEDFTLLLSHSPDISEEPEVKRADLILSGHTHGGQITFFGLWAPVTMSDYGQKYVSGVRRTDYGQTITSNGIGTNIIPMRFFARPQIIILELESSATTEIKINNKLIQAELAISAEEKRIGLMHRTSLCPNCGMLFVFEEEAQHPFWMKNTLIPLDIIFINQNKKIIDIKRAQPCTTSICPIYEPQADHLYALEVPLNTFTDDIIGQNASFNIN